MSATTDALGKAVDAENAAIFTYGVITAFVSGSRRAAVSRDVAAHRARRDALAEAIRSSGAKAPEAAAGYTLPVAVADSGSAARAALAAESDCEAAFRALLEKAGSADARRLGVDGLTETALRAARWRVELRVLPTTEAFPGSQT